MSPQAVSHQRGSAASLTMICAALTVVLIGAGAVLTAGLNAQSTAQQGADLAALAGADALQAGKDPCQAARSTAASNRVTLTACRADSTSVQVRTSTPGTPAAAPFGPYTAESRAGFASDPRQSLGWFPGVPVTGQDGWVRPANGPVTSGFGYRFHPIQHVLKLHAGIDFGAPCGAPIYAAQAGTVTAAGPGPGVGHAITVTHAGGTATRYAHMFSDGMVVRVGQSVGAGQVIGKVGSDGTSTGCHLHFEVRVGGTLTDPAAFLRSVGVAA